MHIIKWGDINRAGPALAQGWHQPWAGIRAGPSPRAGIRAGLAYSGLGQPYSGLGQPSSGLGQPSSGLGQPYSGLGQPSGLGLP